MTGAEFTGIRDVPLSELTRFPGNARRGDVAAIRESVRRNGQYRALVVRDTGSDLVILAGNHTFDALQGDGYAAARCEILRCDDATARRINLADNRTAELGDYDNDALVELLSYLEEDYEGTGWTAEDVEALLTPPDELPPGNGDPDDVPDAPPDPVSKPGDIYALGSHRLLVGDATDMAAVEAMMDGDRADCMWTDPPYGVNYNDFATPEKAKAARRRTDGLRVSNDQTTDVPDLLAGAFAVATVTLKPGAAVYVAYPPGPDGMLFWDAFRGAGWLHRQNLVWVKNALVLGRSDYHYRHEPILYGFTDSGEGRLGRGGERWHGDDSQTTVFEVGKPSRSEQHPTMKPVALITAMIGNSLPKRGIVYDPFGGSGSTLMAAHQLGCRARLVELDCRYADVIVRRWIDFTGIKPERILEDGTTEPVSFT